MSLLYLLTIPHFCPFFFGVFFAFLPVAFYGRLNQGEGKGDEEAEDQPDDFPDMSRWEASI